MASIDIIKVQEMQKYGVGRRRNSGGVVCLQMWLKCSIYRLKTWDPRSCGHLPSQLRGVYAQNGSSGCARSCETHLSQLRRLLGSHNDCMALSFFHQTSFLL